MNSSPIQSQNYSKKCNFIVLRDFITLMIKEILSFISLFISITFM